VLWSYYRNFVPGVRVSSVAQWLSLSSAHERIAIAINEQVWWLGYLSPAIIHAKLSNGTSGAKRNMRYASASTTLVDLRLPRAYRVSQTCSHVRTSYIKHCLLPQYLSRHSNTVVHGTTASLPSQTSAQVTSSTPSNPAPRTF